MLLSKIVIMQDHEMTLQLECMTLRKMNAHIDFISIEEASPQHLQQNQKIQTKVLQSVNIEMKKKTNNYLHLLKIQDIEPLLGENYYLYFNYYVIEFQIFNSYKIDKDYPKIFFGERYTKDINIKTQDLKWNYFKATFIANFSLSDEYSVYLQMPWDKEPTTMSKWKHKWTLDHWIRCPYNPDDDSMILHYNYCIIHSKYIVI